MRESFVRGHLAEWLAREVDPAYERYLVDLARRLRQVVPEQLAREEVLKDVGRWQAAKREYALERARQIDQE
jgi:hypothetical protein